MRGELNVIVERGKRNTSDLLTRIVIALVLCFCLVPAQAAERLAWVIGNSDYLEISPLANPRNDAQDVAVRLQALGFELFGNKVHYNLGERELLARTESFATAAESVEIAFLYFAGHGMQFDGDPHLLPVDIPDASLAIVRREAVGLNGLLDNLAGRAKLTIAVFDACREIPDFKRQIKRATRGGSESGWRGLSRPTVQTESTLIAYSGGSGELVADGEGRNSPYTTLLLDNLDQEIVSPGRNDAPGFFDEVAYQFRQQNSGQSPEVINQGVRPNRFFLSEQQKSEGPVVPEKGRLTVKVEPADARVRIMNIGAQYRDAMELAIGRDYDILVNREGYQPWRNTVTLDGRELVVPVVLVANGPQPQKERAQNSLKPLGNASLVELEWWNLAKELASPASYRNYLGRYPAGEFSEIAKIRLSRLENTSPQSDTGAPTSANGPPGPSNTAPVETEEVKPVVIPPDWGVAQKAGTVAALKRYLKECIGSCEPQAAARVQQIEQQQAAFVAHLRRDELTSGKNGTALEAILTIEDLVPNDTWIADARRQIAERYAVLVRGQQRAGKLQVAQRLVAKGLSVASVQSLENLQIEINQGLGKQKQQTAGRPQPSSENTVSLQETPAHTGLRITLPPDSAKQIGGAVSVKAHVDSEDKIAQAHVYWSTTTDFAISNRQSMYILSSKSSGAKVYSGQFTPSSRAKKVYYYVAVSDKQGNRSTKGSASSPLSYSLPERQKQSKKQTATTVAPLAIAGKIFRMTIGSGSGSFSPKGTYILNISPSGNAYERMATSKDIVDGSGTYKYTVKGAQGLVTFSDSSVGDGDIELNFSDNSSGKFRMKVVADANSIQYGSFKQISKSEAATLTASGSRIGSRKIDFGKDCAKGNIFTKTSTTTNITDRRSVTNSRGKRVPYGSVSTVELSGENTYYIYTKWHNLKNKKYDFHFSLYDSNNNSVIFRRSNGFDTRTSAVGVNWTSWYQWKPSRSAPTGKYTHVICEGGKRHVKTFQVVR